MQLIYFEKENVYVDLYKDVAHTVQFLNSYLLMPLIFDVVAAYQLTGILLFFFLRPY
jgi:hypothetical protein